MNDTANLWVGNQGILGSTGSVVGAVGNTIGAYWTWKNGKAQTKAMQKQLDMTQNQLNIENERYNKRENERLENNAFLQNAGEDFSQAVDKQKENLPVNRI